MYLQKTVIASFVMLKLHIHTDHMVFLKHDETILLICSGKFFKIIYIMNLCVCLQKTVIASFVMLELHSAYTH